MLTLERLETFLQAFPGLRLGLVGDLFLDRYPQDEAINLAQHSNGKLDLGIIHYASDTPYSRRQSLLSKSLSYFGMESTYGAAAAIAQRIFRNEIARLP